MDTHRDLHSLNRRLRTVLGLAPALVLPLAACDAPPDQRAAADASVPSKPDSSSPEALTQEEIDAIEEQQIAEATALMERIGNELVVDPLIEIRLEGDELIPKHVHRVVVTGVEPNTLVSLLGGMQYVSSTAQAPATTCYGPDWCFDLAYPIILEEAYSDLDGRVEFRFLLPWRTMVALFGVGEEAGLQAIVHTPVRRKSEVQPAELVEPYTVEQAIGVLHPGRSAAALPYGERLRVCRPVNADGTCADVASFDDWDALGLAAYGLDQALPPHVGIAACENDAWHPVDCCYVVEAWNANVQPEAPADACTEPTVWTDWALGRPFTSDERHRTAAVGRGAGWDHDLALRPLPSGPLAEAVVSGWLRVARDEHASVASFGRFTLELLALGAPAELVADATRAQADEVRHAQLSFGVASALAGARYAPGPLAIEGALDRSSDPEAVLVAAILEGCINETICAVQQQRVLDHVADEALRARCAEVVEDELRHAELSWRFVRWMLEVHPELADAAQAAFEGFELGSPPAASAHDQALAAHGLVPPADGHRIAAQVLDTVVRPCAEALLDRAIGRVAEA